MCVCVCICVYIYIYIYTSGTHALAHAQPALKEVGPRVFNPRPKNCQPHSGNIFCATYVCDQALSLVAPFQNETKNC